jgi:hypothetical protein
LAKEEIIITSLFNLLRIWIPTLFGLVDSCVFLLRIELTGIVSWHSWHVTRMAITITFTDGDMNEPNPSHSLMAI